MKRNIVNILGIAMMLGSIISCNKINRDSSTDGPSQEQQGPTKKRSDAYLYMPDGSEYFHLATHYENGRAATDTTWTLGQLSERTRYFTANDESGQQKYSYSQGSWRNASMYHYRYTDASRKSVKTYETKSYSNGTLTNEYKYTNTYSDGRIVREDHTNTAYGYETYTSKWHVTYDYPSESESVKITFDENGKESNRTETTTDSRCTKIRNYGIVIGEPGLTLLSEEEFIYSDDAHECCTSETSSVYYTMYGEPTNQVTKTTRVFNGSQLVELTKSQHNAGNPIYDYTIKETYTYEGENIVRFERHFNGTLSEWTTYAYNEKGQLSSTEEHDSSSTKWTEFTYEDGCLILELTYLQNNGSAKYLFRKITNTYDPAS